MDSDKVNGNISFMEKTTSTEDLSEYTDADESISTPTEILSEFLSSIMAKDYSSAFKYCKLILQYEPNHQTAKEFFPLLFEKCKTQYTGSGKKVKNSSDDEADEFSCSASTDNNDDHSSDGFSFEQDANSEGTDLENESSEIHSDFEIETSTSYSSLDDGEIQN